MEELDQKEPAFGEYVPVANRPKTWIFDLDGTLLRQGYRFGSSSVHPVKIDFPKLEVLPGALDLLSKLWMRGDTIIIMTARPEGYRRMTEWQLRKAGFMWHQLVMGVPTGQRVLVNDRKPQEQTATAIAVNVDRDHEESLITAMQKQL